MAKKRTNQRRSRRKYPSQRLLFWSWERDAKGEYRVHARHTNHEIAWSSSEGYKRRDRAINNALLFGAPNDLRIVGQGVAVDALSLGEAP